MSKYTIRPVDANIHIRDENWKAVETIFKTMIECLEDGDRYEEAYAISWLREAVLGCAGPNLRVSEGVLEGILASTLLGLAPFTKATPMLKGKELDRNLCIQLSIRDGKVHKNTFVCEWKRIKEETVLDI